jgi:predicted ATPase
VIVETHSSLLLLGVQTLVAEGKLSPDLVKLHWFQRDMTTGATTITGADLDEMGAFGEEFPEDFDDVTLKADRAYLDAVEKKSFLS